MHTKKQQANTWDRCLPAARLQVNIGLCYTAILPTDIVIDGGTIVVDVFFGITFGKLNPQQVANGILKSGSCFLLVKWMIHGIQLLLDFLK